LNFFSFFLTSAGLRLFIHKIWLIRFLLLLADGIALGAAATTAQKDVEAIVFLAIMLHKVLSLANLI